MSEVIALNASRPDYGYIDHVVRTIRISAGVLEQPTLPIEKGPLLSIHLQSNRPDNFTSYMENLVASADDPSRIEVVVKIDDTDAPMNVLLPQLVEKYRDVITLKYISTPLVGGFFELWRSMNDMLKICHPHAYFLWNMNDEMAVLNKGWDTALAKYVGMFPDHLFRLRTSVFRSRNYYDYWECGFAPETSAITTKRWLDICGDWNPCLGPDSFNQCVAYYLGYHDRFYKLRVDRDIPVHDFIFAGEGAFIGMSGEVLYRRARGACKAWYRLMSHEIQQEASRRAQRLMATIWAQREFSHFKIEDNTARGRFEVYDLEDKRKKPDLFPYKLSKLRIKLTNLHRASAYYYYAGGGVNGTPHSRARQVIGYLALRFQPFNWMRTQLMRSRGAKHGLNNVVIKIASSLKFIPVNWDVWAAYHEKRLPLHSVAAFICRSALSIIPRAKQQEPHGYEQVDREMDWAAIKNMLAGETWPVEFSALKVQLPLVKCIMLKQWYTLTGKQLEKKLRRDAMLCHYLDIDYGRPVPQENLVNAFAELLKQKGKYAILEAIMNKKHVTDALPPLLNDISPEKSGAKQVS